MGVGKNGRARHARAEGAPSPLALPVLSCAHYFQAPALVEFDCLLFCYTCMGKAIDRVTNAKESCNFRGRLTKSNEVTVDEEEHRGFCNL